ncbi:hypothetical protein RFI_22864 [Reticulomyxa filosa]|uniref:Protein kinase domain-containing protein n=1 Tax=Reticulomyxa filosa TaxID=46433 RepID=X6MKY3_RETFI|nr:hypothetical protein RFI_22864 [Reticulomyxa filosa]|eukprot:ETO14504.1 hypothetical protein RFI_22864 [Reticulomyxa filosa]
MILFLAKGFSERKLIIEKLKQLVYEQTTCLLYMSDNYFKFIVALLYEYKKYTVLNENFGSFRSKEEIAGFKSVVRERKKMAKIVDPNETKVEEKSHEPLDTTSGAPSYLCNDKGFMEFSDQLVIDKRYVLQKPKKVDELELDHGKGRYGSVYCAYDKKEKMFKAVKILKLPEKDGEDVKNQTSKQKRGTHNFKGYATRTLKKKNYIRRELRVLKRITNNELGEEDNEKGIICPFVIQLLGHGTYENHSYFVFDYFEVTLQQHLEYILQLNYESLTKLKQQILDSNNQDIEANENDGNGNDNDNNNNNSNNNNDNDDKKKTNPKNQKKATQKAK